MSERPAPQPPSEDALSPATVERTAGPVELVLLLAGSCLTILGAVLISPILPQMSRAFADSPGVDVLVPVVLTAPALMIGLTAPLSGLIADRIDRKRLLLVAMVAYALFGTAPLYLNSLYTILVSRVLVGLCEGAIMTCCTTLIGDYWSGARRAKYLGLQTLVTSLAATVFLTLGGLLGAAGWRTPFWLYLVAALLAVPMALKLWQPAHSTESAAGRRAPTPWRQLLAPCLVTLFGGVVFYVLVVELSFVLTDVGVASTGAIGGIAALMSLATATGSYVFGRVSGRAPRVLLPVEFTLSGVGLLLVFATTSPVVVTIGAVLSGLGSGLMLPTLLTWSVNRLSFEQRGRGTGLFMAALFLAEFACPLIVSALTGPVQGLQNALGLLGGVTLIFAIVVAVALRRNDQPLNQAEQ